MKLRRNRYYMLVSSLPAQPRRLDDPGPLISRERLADRLKMLEPEDAADIETLRAVIEWGQQIAEPADAAVVAGAEALSARVENPLVRELLELGMDARMIAVALRSRRRNVALPTVGFGNLLPDLRRNLKQPDLRLLQRFPWIVEADALFGRGDLLTLYRRFVLGTLWEYCRRRAESYMFEFEAVVLYVARWDCLRRWKMLDPERGRQVFEALVTETLGEYANVYA